jgi:putative DNA primase/helicase
MGDIVKSAGGISVPIVDPAAMAWKELSDLGNAERLVERAGGKLMYVENMGWVAYDGTRWTPEDGMRLASLKAHEVARGMREEVAALGAVPDEQLKTIFGEWCTVERRQNRVVELHKHAVGSGNANKTTAMLSQAAHLLSGHRDDFDRDPYVLNVSNGTLRFLCLDGKWVVSRKDHDPADMISRVCDTHWDANATCANWTKHLETVLPDKGVRDYFQSCIGYVLTGLIDEQCIFMLQGKGNDGKSVTMNVLRQVMGGYGFAADVQTFMAGAQRSGGDATPDLARLSGDVRLVSVGEPKRGGAIDEARIKSVTGGSPITARVLHGDPFEYTPKFKVLFECNGRPRISGDDDGIWRRIRIILFPRQFRLPHQSPSPHMLEPVKGIDRLLLDERAGILNWAIEGALEWLNAGTLVTPQSMKEAVEDYRRSANPFGEWMAERLDTGPEWADHLEHAKALFDDYKKWCEDNSVADKEVLTSTSFGRAMGDRQILKGPKDSAGLVRRRGARLRDGFSIPPASEPVRGPENGPPDDDFVPNF